MIGVKEIKYKKRHNYFVWTNKDNEHDYVSSAMYGLVNTNFFDEY